MKKTSIFLTFLLLFYIPIKGIKWQGVHYKFPYFEYKSSQASSTLYVIRHGKIINQVNIRGLILDRGGEDTNYPKYIVRKGKIDFLDFYDKVNFLYTRHDDLLEEVWINNS